MCPDHRFRDGAFALSKSSIPFFMGRIVPVEYAKRAKYQPPAMRVRDGCYTKKSPFRYNEVVQAYHNERKGDFNG